MLKKIATEKIPDYALCPIFNDDYSGLMVGTEEQQKEDEDNIRNFLELYDGCDFELAGEEAYFSYYPAFGLPCMVYDVDVFQNK